MVTARVCKVVEAPAGPLFEALADWGGWGAWLPGEQAFELESGGPGIAGSVRVITPPGASAVRERLTGCDQVERSITYQIDGEAPFPARNYRARVQLLALTDRAGTVVEWTATFDADTVVEAPVRAALEGYFAAFVDSVTAYVSA